MGCTRCFLRHTCKLADELMGAKSKLCWIPQSPTTERRTDIDSLIGKIIEDNCCNFKKAERAKVRQKLTDSEPCFGDIYIRP